MPFFRVFLSVIFMLGFATPAFCGVGNVDNREYVSDEEWSQEPWKKYVALVDEQYNYESYCTAQYIAPNLILSAGHCLITGQDGYLAKNYKKEIIPIKKLYTTYVKEQNKFEDPGDWVVFLVQDPKYYSDSFFNIEKPETSQDFLQVQTAGWGSMRILTDEELTQIRNIIKAIPENTEDFFKDLNIKMSEQGMELIYDVHNRLKKSGCHIALADCQTLSNNPNFTSACKNSANLNKINFPNILATTCDIMDGNSGGAVIDMTGSRLYGTVSFGSGGRYQYYDDTNHSYIASSYQFHDNVETLKREHSVTVPNESGPANDEIPPATLVQNLQPIHPSQISTKIDDLTGDIAALGTRLQAQYPGIAEAPDERLLNFLATVAEYQVKSDRLEELKKKYQEAKEREQSDANRALTALTTAATGLGTMAAASALAERKADEKAEADMRQYLTTMQCEYGKGNIVNAGNEEITIPGGNELSKYYAEYKSLADNLKTTKTALGLRAGIESETLYEQSQMGLYQYSTAERQTGAYASLSRALTDPESEDAAAWAKQKKDTKTKLIAGAAVAGAGVVGGIVGNQIINGGNKDNNHNTNIDATSIGNRIGNEIRNKNIPTLQNSNQQNNDENETCDSIIQSMKDAACNSHGYEAYTYDYHVETGCLQKVYKACDDLKQLACDPDLSPIISTNYGISGDSREANTGVWCTFERDRNGTVTPPADNPQDGNPSGAATKGMNIAGDAITEYQNKILAQYDNYNIACGPNRTKQIELLAKDDYNSEIYKKLNQECLVAGGSGLSMILDRKTLGTVVYNCIELDCP